jgi:hypothetical protein
MLKFHHVYQTVKLCVKVMGTSRIYKLNCADSTRLKDVTNMLSKMMGLNALRSEFEYYQGWPLNPRPSQVIPKTYTVKQCRLDSNGHLSIKLVKSEPIGRPGMLIINNPRKVEKLKEIELQGSSTENTHENVHNHTHGPSDDRKDIYAESQNLNTFLKASRGANHYEYEKNFITTQSVVPAMRTLMCETQIDVQNTNSLEKFLQTRTQNKQLLETINAAHYPEYKGTFPSPHIEDDPDVGDLTKRRLCELFSEITKSQQ